MDNSYITLYCKIRTLIPYFKQAAYILARVTNFRR